MARTPKPWFWQARAGWYVTIDGQRHWLADGKTNKGRANRAFHELMAADREARRAAGEALRVGDVCGLYSDHAAESLAPLTAEYYARFLDSFATHSGGLSSAQAAPRHVLAWLAKHPGWGQSTKGQAITAVKRAFRWARRQGYIVSDPFADMEKPAMGVRAKMMTAQQADAIRAEFGAGDPFGDLLDFLRDTGARPSEAMRAEAKHLNATEQLLVMPGKTTRRTGKSRKIHLTPAITARLAELAQAHPFGSLFRMTNGKPWNRNAIVSRFRRLRDKLGMGAEATAESYRHLFATDLLEAGVPIASAAELMGHASTAMLSKHYSKLAERHAHLKAELSKARGGPHSPLPQDSGPQIDSGALRAAGPDRRREERGGSETSSPSSTGGT